MMDLALLHGGCICWAEVQPIINMLPFIGPFVLGTVAMVVTRIRRQLKERGTHDESQ